MPQLAEIIEQTLDAVTKSVDKHELTRLRQHVKAVKELGGKTPGVDEILDLLGEGDDGYLPYFSHAAEGHVNASLAMSTSRERIVNAGGTVTFGPVSIRGDYGSKFGQDTATNLQVDIKLERKLISQQFKELLDGLL